MNLQRQKRRRRTSPMLNLRRFLQNFTDNNPHSCCSDSASEQTSARILAVTGTRVNQTEPNPHGAAPAPPGERHSLTFTTAAVLAAPFGMWRCHWQSDEQCKKTKKKRQKKRKKQDFSFFFLAPLLLVAKFYKSARTQARQTANSQEERTMLLSKLHYEQVSIYITCYRMFY